MLVLDSDARMEWQKAAGREKSAAQRQKDLEHDLVSNTISVSDDGGVDRSDLLAQIGKPMTAQDVIAKLKLCNPSLVFVKHPMYALYGIYLRKGDKQVHICGMESGIMPERSVLHKKKKQVPNADLFLEENKHKPTREVAWKEIDTFAAETRGWRTVLVRLLHQRLITQAQVDQHFGWMPSRPSKRWYEETKETIHVAKS